MTAGWDNGFFLASADGNFRLNINGQLQSRFMANFSDSTADFDTDGDGVPNPGSGDDDRWGFEMTRAKLKFHGHVVSPEWVYMIEGNFDRNGGDFELEDAYIAKVFGDSGWMGIFGQFKVPMLREEGVYSAYQQAVERSLVNEEFTAGRTQGVALDYRGDAFHVIAGYTDGHPATGGFNSPALSRDTEYALTARAEYLFSGAWSQFDDFASWRGEDTAIMVGGAIHYQDGEWGDNNEEIEVVQWTVDGSFEFGGWNLFSYFVGRHLDSRALNLDQYGLVVQGGFFLNDDWELFGRWEWSDDDFSSDDLSILTFGFNRYYKEHQLKWTTDVGFGTDRVTGTYGGGFLGGGGDIAGWRTDAPGDDGQLVLRTQFQLLF
jgi:hypothetical protein